MFLLDRQDGLIPALSIMLITATSITDASFFPQITQDAAIYGLTNDKTDYTFSNNSLPASSLFEAPESSTTNATVPLTTLNADIAYHCSSGDYGVPQISACSNAFDQIPFGTHYDVFGDRTNPGADTYDAPLPWRVLSGTLRYIGRHRFKKINRISHRGWDLFHRTLLHSPWRP